LYYFYAFLGINKFMFAKNKPLFPTYFFSHAKYTRFLTRAHTHPYTRTFKKTAIFSHTKKNA
jgi:hypothetical protein